MRKLLKRIVNVLRGLLNDFWMMPLAGLLIYWQEGITHQLNLMPTLNEVKVGNVVPALIVFLIAMTLVRAYFWLQYSDVYEDSLMRQKNKLWESLSDWQRFLLLRLERWVLILAFVLIYLAMF